MCNMRGQVHQAGESCSRIRAKAPDTMGGAELVAHATEGNGFVTCELCTNAAYVFCQADEAHLCHVCDTKVHTANFLVSRHVRAVLCAACAGETAIRICGARPEVVKCKCCRCKGSTLALLEPDAIVGEVGMGVRCQSDPVRDTLMQGTVEAMGPGKWAVEKVVEVVYDREVGMASCQGVEESHAGAGLPRGVSVSGAEQVLGSKRSWDEEDHPLLKPTERKWRKVVVSKSKQQPEQHAMRGAQEAPSTSDSCSVCTETDSICKEQDSGWSGPSALGLWHEEREAGSVDGTTVSEPRRQQGHSAQDVNMAKSYSVERLHRILAAWCQLLGIAGARIVPAALSMFGLCLKQLQPKQLTRSRWRAVLATCLLIAGKAANTALPLKSLASVTDVKPLRLVEVEAQLLSMLQHLASAASSVGMK